MKFPLKRTVALSAGCLYLGAEAAHIVRDPGETKRDALPLAAVFVGTSTDTGYTITQAYTFDPITDEERRPFTLVPPWNQSDRT